MFRLGELGLGPLGGLRLGKIGQNCPLVAYSALLRVKQSDLRKIRMMGLSDNERISMTGSAVLTQYMLDRCTDYGISVTSKSLPACRAAV